jgi:hypothetical protein
MTTYEGRNGFMERLDDRTWTGDCQFCRVKPGRRKIPEAEWEKWLEGRRDYRLNTTQFPPWSQVEAAMEKIEKRR